MRKNNLVLVLVTVLGVAVIAPAGKAEAQTEALKKAVENVKQSVDILVTARDDNAPNDFGLRLEAFKKVISLSISEAKDFKVKLVLADDDKEIKIWRDSVMERLNAVLGYLSEEQDIVTSGRLRDGEAVKNAAQVFKEWRDGIYTPLAEEVESFFIVGKSGEVIDTASKRVEKINKDITKLQKLNPKTALNLKNMMKKAGGMIDDGAVLQRKANDAFESKYVAPVLEGLATSTDGVLTTSTEDVVLDNDKKDETKNDMKADGANEESIKDLVRASFAKVREAYQIFIEMSVLVRGAL